MDIANSETLEPVRKSLPIVKDFPVPGISFIDIMPIMYNHDLRDIVLNDFINRYKSRQDIQAIAGLEARGFLLGTPLAHALKLPFIPIRKGGKLPGDIASVEYSKEYGTDVFQVQKSALKNIKNVVVIDDLIATGGTLAGTMKLMQEQNINVLEIGACIELSEFRAHRQFDVPIYVQMVI